MKSLLVFGLLCAAHLAVAQRTTDICRGLPAGTGFVNDFASCDAYFSCIQGVPHAARCPFPFIFNPNGPFGPICDYPFNVNCQQCPETGLLAVPNPYFCNKFTQCINGVAIERECAPHTAFDREEGMCIADSDVSCEDINPCGKLDGGTGNAPSTRDCSQFVICFEGKVLGEPFNCPQGLRFDSKHMRCARREDALCYPGTIDEAKLILAPVANYL